ncbi:1-phosphatidylinositol-3-phosphate 5-kinase FAB1A-like isoform X2 [Panicum miliaceum]|uniref:1-phosphatidylinositol-3-phosphate 5-kinase n=1 Tax=Panicum miliaceum TaxID=4540 RepID=A0A3L6S193_PANMI|nr:1-phosphatidylinositol-3-phosphate 5-kinase FAB1A-like isoform X2 [Panicum miliaceum]
MSFRLHLPMPVISSEPSFCIRSMFSRIRAARTRSDRYGELGGGLGAVATAVGRDNDAAHRWGAAAQLVAAGAAIVDLRGSLGASGVAASGPTAKMATARSWSISAGVTGRRRIWGRPVEDSEPAANPASQQAAGQRKTRERQARYPRGRAEPDAEVAGVEVRCSGRRGATSWVAPDLVRKKGGGGGGAANRVRGGADGRSGARALGRWSLGGAGMGGSRRHGAANSPRESGVTRDDDALQGANPNHLLRHSYNPSTSGESELSDDATIWIPPEAADDMEDGHGTTTTTTHHHRYHAASDTTSDDTTVTTEEDEDSDDDDDDGSFSWCQQQQQPTSSNAAYSYREERQKAMLRAMNGQLKMLAARFLESAGIPAAFHHQLQGADTCCWLDIVTSLSWEAALLIRPDATAGNEMDPSSYVKVKCLASGTRRQCEVIRGLVFKKNAAHKHMPTRCHNPRLLLLRGVLGDSDVGFSSFSSIEQEKDHLEKSVYKMMQICRPNVVMVEKTVSRDIQELLLEEGVTLVLDMKLNRLQRIARCSGSPILSFSEVLSKPKLKQCDYFHIEKVTKEHNHTAEAGKRQSKTLMYLEGFRKPLGCTILLRGANSEELKKVKQVMQYTVFAAYHLVLETSFFEDHRVILNNKNASKEEISISSKAESSVIRHGIPAAPSIGYDPVGPKLYPLTSSESVEEPTKGRTVTVVSSTKIEDPNSLEKGFPSEKLVSSVPGSPRRSIDILRYQNIYLPVTSSQEVIDHQKEDMLLCCQDMASNGVHISPDVGVQVGSGENVNHLSDPQNQEQMTLDDPSVSEQPSTPLENGEQHSTSYITGDKTSDIDEVDDVLEPQSILILLSSQCITKQVICEQSHLSRIKYYGDFDVSLGRYLQDILQNQNLSCSSCGEPPEAHMYSYTHRNGNLTVLVKRLPKYCLPGESEGKIWMWTRCLRCEHESGISRSSRRVLMSAEAHYLSFGKFLELSFSSHSTARRLSICGHSLNKDCLRFFGLGSKVAMFQYSSVEIYTASKPQPTLEFHNPNTHEWYGQEVLARGVMLFSEVTGLLQNLKDQFSEVVIHCGAFLPIEECSQLEDMLIKEKSEFMCTLAQAVDRSGAPSSVHEILSVNWLYQDLLLELYVWDRRLHQLLECISAGRERMGIGVKGTSEFTGDQTAVVAEADGVAECASSKVSFENGCIETDKYSEPGTGTTLLDENAWDKHYEEQLCIKVPSSGISDFLDVQNNELVARSMCPKQEPPWDDREKWVWNPLHESRLAYRQELEVGCLERFELVNNYCPSHLSPLNRHDQSGEEVGSPQFTVGPCGSVLCVSEDEISSIISRALAISEERRYLLDAITESAPADSRVGERTKTMEKSYSSVSESSSASSLWSSTWPSSGSSDSEASISSDDLSSYDSSLLSSSQHPEISVNGRVALKGKYSVICVHSNQFYNLRKKCCPSELGYITSLSRCKKWDAQGGKSKAFFAKTVDDRFIIKQIKRTEFESFIKFAPDYFKHVKQIRHGKEIKMDLMVMENILFGHSVSRTYDLKGAVFSRHVSDSNDHDTVYLDQNFVDDMRVSPIYIGGRTKHLLQRAIWNDTAFLTSINVMDYSLLVGVDKQKHELVFGIIDYLRQYTWDKQLETWVKTSLVVPKNESPTVISPREYKKRFRKFMSKYFLTVPDDWSTENPPPVSCKSCGHAGSANLPGVVDEKPPQNPNPNPIVACA